MLSLEIFTYQNVRENFKNVLLNSNVDTTKLLILNVLKLQVDYNFISLELRITWNSVIEVEF